MWGMASKKGIVLHECTCYEAEIEMNWIEFIWVSCTTSDHQGHAVTSNVEAKERCVSENLDCIASTVCSIRRVVSRSQAFARSSPACKRNLQGLQATNRRRPRNEAATTLLLSDRIYVFRTCRSEKKANSCYRKRWAKKEASTDKLHERTSPTTRGGFCTNAVSRFANAGANSRTAWSDRAKDSCKPIAL